MLREEGGQMRLSPDEDDKRKTDCRDGADWGSRPR